MANGAGIVKHFAAVAAAVLLGALFVTGTSLTAPAAAATSASSGDILALLNAERSAAGLPPLREAPDLTAAAQLRAESMARTGKLEHTRSLTRLVVPGDGLGENVGYAASPQDVNREFMESSSHRSAILSSSYDEVGVGVVPAGEVIWVTEIFRNAAPSVPSKPAAVPAPRPKALPLPAVGAPLASSPPPPLLSPSTTVPRQTAAAPVPVPVTVPLLRAAPIPTPTPTTVAATTVAPTPVPKAIADSRPNVRMRAAAAAVGMVAALFALLPVRMVPFRRTSTALTRGSLG